MAHPRSAYTGSESILVIAIDVGTTYSGASYTILVPEHVPQIFDVKGYEGQEDRQGNTKVPSVLIYSHEGKILACGAEIAKVKPHEGVRTEWFKLELQPPTMKVDGRPEVTLPPGRTAIDVFGDFLKYMHNCVRKHIVESQFNGNQLWSSLNGTAHFVLSHPNGWEPDQQNDMRRAAIRGGLVPDTPEGHDRIEFVTEGEASLHWCTDQGMAGVDIKEGTNVVVADLGGGTIDVSSFVVKTPKPLCLRERRSPECEITDEPKHRWMNRWLTGALAGSITVTSRFMEAMTPRLLNTDYSDDDYIHALRDEFDQKTKCIFNEKTDTEVYIRIGRRTDNFVAENGAFRIEFGLLQVQRQDIVDAFEPSIAATVNAIRAHLAGTSDAYVFLVGGFSASPWMLSETRRRLTAEGIRCQLKRADSGMAKAAARGGVACYLDRHVTERIMRHTYGVILDVPFHPEDPEHQDRSQDLKEDPNSGKQYVRGGFSALVTRGQLVKVDKVYKERCRSDARPKQEPIRWTQTIQRYSGAAGNVTFVDVDPDGFTSIGSFYCDIPASAMTMHMEELHSFWAVDLDIVFTLGTVEVKAYVEWEEQGIKKRTRAMSIREKYY